MARGKGIRGRRAWGARDTLFVGLIMAFGIVAAAAGLAFAVHGGATFELDADAADSPAGGADDWSNVYRSVTGQGSAAPSKALVQTFIDDAAEPDHSTFGMSNKDSQPAGAWQCNSDNNPQGKTNVLHAYAALYSVAGDLVLYFGADREVNTGDANFGFWFFQDRVGCVPPEQGGTGAFTGRKTHGDLFIVSEFTNGGRVSSVKVYQWTDPTPDAPESGDECLGNGIDCSPANSGEEHPRTQGVDCQDPDADSVNAFVCATVNSAAVDAPWRPGMAARELFEGGLNLSQLVGPQIGSRCFGTFLAETRSSQEFEADLKDFVGGELGTCTQVTIRKQAIGGDGEFAFEATAGALDPAAFTLPGGGEHVYAEVPAGTHTIREVVPAGWQLTDIQCRASGGGTSAAVDLAGGAVTVTAGLAGTVDCTFTNAKRPSLTVVKVVENQWGGTRTASQFTVRVNGQAVTSGVPTLVASGTHVVSEDAPPAGYEQVGIGGDCDAAGRVTLAAGQHKTCVITNRDIAPRLTVVKHVVNDHGGALAPADFTMLVTGTAVSQPSFAGSAAGVTVSLAAGPYSVDELAAPGYAKSLGAECAGVIALGETRTCTIVNDDVAPRLTVIKQVVNDNGGAKTPADFTMQVAGTGVSSPAFPGSAAGVTVTLAAGAYAVTETGPAGYSQTSAAGCAGTIGVGESRTCTLVNDDVVTQLVVVKQVVNDDGGSAAPAAFTMQVAGTGVSSPAFPGSAAGVTVTLQPGPYSVTETGPAGYAQISAVGCAGVIAAGETRTCTLVNDDVAPRLTVVKQVVNDHGGTKGPADFTMQVAGTAVSTSAFAGSDAGVTVTLAAGAYAVTETGPAGYAQISAVGCAGTLAVGETRTCTLVNDDVAPRLVVIKRVVNDSGGRAVAGDFTMLVTGTNVSQSAFPGSETGTTVTLRAGAYSVSEVLTPGYEQALDGGCAGVIGVGETRTCTVTNTDLPLIGGTPFCDSAGVQALMDPLTGRFPANLGPDVVVDGSAVSIQAAVDNAADVNGDGYVIVGLVAKGGSTLMPFGAGGRVNQSLRIGRSYDKPFALVACQVVLQDPLVCDGVAPALITAAAGSPEHPVGSGTRLFVYGLAAEGSESAPAWLVQGDGRHLEAIGANDSVVGIKIQGHRNTVRGATVTAAWVDGFVVEGNDNTVDGARIVDGGGDALRVTGHRNDVIGSAVGDHGVGNVGTGIAVTGRGNHVVQNSVYSNLGHGIAVGGGTAGSPNVVKGNVVGAPYRGNSGHGIAVAGTGNGTTNPVEIAANTVQSNGGSGIVITGTGHQLRGNVSGGAGFRNNAGCEFDVAAGNYNVSGNKTNGTAITGSNGSPFPTGCR